ncbi:MAG: hypothetical protein HP495_00655, partial [Nitrospira sp.]|nr:hypothetical protein [Nitrospira sp.]
MLSTWMIRTLVGNGEPGFTGDGGPSLYARLNEPKGVAVDDHGNVYVADSENHVIRKIERATGIISTVVGMPPEGQREEDSHRDHVISVADEDPFADSRHESAQQSYVQQSDLSGTVRYVMTGTAPLQRYAGDGGLAVAASLNFP